MRTLLIGWLGIVLITCEAVKRPVGKLSEAENLDLSETCGQQLQSEVKFASLSPRHIVVDVSVDFLQNKWTVDECNNDVFEITKIDSSHIWQFGNELNATRAWFIGSCNSEILRGFILVEHDMDPENFGSPLCIPKADLKPGHYVERFQNINVPGSPDYTFTEVDLCPNDPIRDLCLTVPAHFSGPVVDPWEGRREYVGHAYRVENGLTRIIVVHQYKMQICEVSGICETSTENSDSSNSIGGLAFSVESSIPDDFSKTNVDVTFVASNDDPNYGSSSSHAEIVYVDSDEEEVSGFNPLNYDSSEYTDEPIEFEEEMPIPSPKIQNPETTVVEAAPEPLSAVIIPLPETPTAAKISSEFSSPTELLIAALILLALFFYVCMCINGCVEYNGEPVFGRVASGGNSLV